MDQNNELQLPIDLIETITDDKLRNNVTLDLSQRITAPVGDIKEIMDHANTILSSNYRFNNATSFKDISSRLTKEKLNVESKTVTVAATSSAVSTEIKPDDDYVGLGSVVVNVKPLQNLEVSRIIPENFNYIPDDSAELETIYLKPTNTTSTAIDITIATDNPTEYSGLNIVKINDIGIIQNQKFTVAKEHLISSNTFKVVFADDKHFGASDVDITVPLVKNKRFTVNKNTIGRTYVPAEGDLALDGTSMTDTVPAIGFESVTLDASIASGVTASTLKSLALSGQGGNKISPSGTALGYESVEIPTLEILEASKVKAALVNSSTTIKPSLDIFGYSTVQLPQLETYSVSSEALSSFVYSLDNSTESSGIFKCFELYCAGHSSYTVDAEYVSSVQASGATEIHITKQASSIYVQGVTDSSTIGDTIESSDTGILNKVVVKLPQSTGNPVIVYKDANVYIGPAPSYNDFDFISHAIDIPTYVGNASSLDFEAYTSGSAISVYLLQYDKGSSNCSGYVSARNTTGEDYHTMLVKISNGIITVEPGIEGVELEYSNWDSTKCNILKVATSYW